MGKGVSAPEPRSPAKEYPETVAAQIKVQPDILAALQTYGPQYTGVNIDLLGKALAGNLGLTDQYGGQVVEQQNRLRQQQISLDPILKGLQDAAMQDVSMGGNLSPEERIAATEVARSRYANLGTLGSNQSLLDQILGRAAYSDARRQQRLSTASGINSILQGLNGGGLQNMLVGNAGNTVALPGINPESAYAQDIYNTNYNGQMNAYISGKNNRAGLMSGILKGVAGIGLGLATGGLGFGAMGAGSAAGGGAAGGALLGSGAGSASSFFLNPLTL